MRLADKIATMARRGTPLPYLRRLAYLEQTGNQIILLGVVLRDVTVRIRYMLKSGQFGMFTTLTSGGVYLGTSQWYGGDYVYRVNGSSAATLKDFGSVNEIDIRQDGETVRVHQTGYDEIALIAQYTGGYDAYAGLFGDGRAMRKCPVGSRLYFFKGHVDGTEFDLTPVMSLDGEPCLYDEVSGQLFRNAGTGTFAYGELDASSSLSASRGGVLNA